MVPRALARAPGNRPGLVRSVPDISADADLFTGMAVGLFTFKKGQPPAFHEIPVGGTSLAAPLVAGMVTAAQAGRPRRSGSSTRRSTSWPGRMPTSTRCR